MNFTARQESAQRKQNISRLFEIAGALDIDSSATIEFIEFVAFVEKGYVRAILKVALGIGLYHALEGVG